MKFPTYKEMGEKIAEQALDEYVINGKTLREWIKLLSEQEPKTDKVMMRDATPEEQKSVDNYIKSISKPTGVNFGTLEPCDDVVSRQAVLEHKEILRDEQGTGYQAVKTKYIRELSSVQPKRQTYTEDELKEFADGISLRLCSLKSAEYWGGKYTEQIAWLEKLYAKVKADMRGESND